MMSAGAFLRRRHWTMDEVSRMIRCIRSTGLIFIIALLVIGSANVLESEEPKELLEPFETLPDREGYKALLGPFGAWYACMGERG